jgi:hypothetical protein
MPEPFGPAELCKRLPDPYEGVMSHLFGVLIGDMAIYDLKDIHFIFLEKKGEGVPVPVEDAGYICGVGGLMLVPFDMINHGGYPYRSVITKLTGQGKLHIQGASTQRRVYRPVSPRSCFANAFHILSITEPFHLLLSPLSRTIRKKGYKKMGNG